jgi:hypothetical protein
MALFWEQECPLCGIKITDTDRLFATSHFLDSDNDLWQFSDTAMHWDCYAKWEHRKRFSRMYFDTKREWSRQNPFWRVAYSDDQVLVTVNSDQFVDEVDMVLAETGSEFRIPLTDWEGWLSGKCFEDCHHEIERNALAVVISLLRSRLPTAEAVIAATGMEVDAEFEKKKDRDSN